MIPAMHTIAWSRVAPWAAPRQVEQDLIISRAMVDLFNDEFLKEQLRFRGGTGDLPIGGRSKDVCKTRQTRVRGGYAAVAGTR